MNDPKTMLIGAGAISGLLFVLSIFTFLLLRRKKPAKGSVESRTAIAGHGDPNALPNAAAAAEALQHQMQEKLAAQQALQAQADEAALSSLKLPTVTTKKSEVLVKHLRESVTKDTPGSANILRSWLTESGTE
jgi:hypothetical protein